MKYPSNAAPKNSGPAPGGSQSPGGPRPLPTPANDNTPKPPRPANDNIRKGGRNAVGRYARFLRSPLIQSAAAALLYPMIAGTRVSLDSYQPTVVCAAGGQTLTVPGSCGGYIVNIPWPATAITGRPINVSFWSILNFRPNGLQMNVVHNVRYTRVSNEAWRRPVQQWPISPLPAPEYEYPPVPSLEPHKVPPMAPAPVPAPVPLGAIPGIPPNPFAPGGTGRVGGNSPPSRGRGLIGWPLVPDAPKPAPEPKPNEVPADVVTLVPGVRTGLTPGGHSLRPPRKGEKERKLSATLEGWPLKLLNFATEAGDFIDAFYDALPVGMKIRRRYIRADKWGPYAKDFLDDKGRLLRKRTDLQGVTWYLEPLTHADKAKQLYRYWDKLRPEFFAEAFQNLRENEVEDRLFGTSSQRLNRSLQKSKRRGYGSQRGLQWGLAL